MQSNHSDKHKHLNKDSKFQKRIAWKYIQSQTVTTHSKNKCKVIHICSKTPSGYVPQLSRIKQHSIMYLYIALYLENMSKLMFYAFLSIFK